MPEYVEVLPNGHLLTEIRQVAGGAQHTCALRAEGSVFCWGDNSVGQLGDGTRNAARAPVRVRQLPPARWIAAGARTTCAATNEGAVYCWGANSVGQCGDGQQANGYALPVRVMELENATEPTSSPFAERTCAITENGTVACWGRLAAVDAQGRPLLASIAPVLASNVTNAVAVAIGISHECALSDTGRVLCRGLGTHGELGSARREASEFVEVRGIDRVVSIAAGARHTCAARADGTLFCWGDNAQGQLGLRDTQRTLVPTRVELPIATRAVVAGMQHTCALDELGGVTCFGDNTDMQLGDGSREPGAHARTVQLEARAEDISSGANHTCALLDSGELRCWGDNVNGQLGDGTIGDDRAWPVAVLDGPELGEFEPELGLLGGPWS